jgi:predicted component of viral defense system (DUF524 family)
MRSVSLVFTDRAGVPVGKVVIYSPSADNALIVINEQEALEYGEQEVQLLEGKTYEYEIVEIFSDQHAGAYLATSISEGGVIKHSPVRGRSFDSGRIEPNLYTGLIDLILVHDSKPIGYASVEVMSSKTSYREDYRTMLEDISAYSADLLMHLRAPSQTRFSPDIEGDPETLQQRFAFVKAIIDSPNFRNALDRIIALPNRELDIEIRDTSIHHSFKSSSSLMRQLVRGARRIPVPTEHPLYTKMRREGIVSPTLPTHIQDKRKRDTLDTPENRFIKYALEIFTNFIWLVERKIQQYLSTNPDITPSLESGYRNLAATAIRLREDLSRILNRDFFKDVSALTLLPLSSPVLQRKPGYREVFRAWLHFELAAKLVWSGGDDVYYAGKRDVATLYEYWLFFKLLELITTMLTLDTPPVEKLFELTADGFGLKLKTGNILNQSGFYLSGTRRLRVQFSYNRTFEYNRNEERAGSWTQRMRPDFTLSFWPDTFTLAEAERQSLVTHIHFDAKYSVENLKDLFGLSANNVESELHTEKRMQRLGTFKRGHLLKMHAYRDAIRRTMGAYIIYPGDTNKNWLRFNGYEEILPGLGAFAVQPGSSSSSGMNEIGKFIQSALENLTNRLSRRERHTYHTFAVYNPLEKQYQKYPNILPETDTDLQTRALPPAEHSIALAIYKSPAELKWFSETGNYVWAIGNEFEGALTSARHMLLFSPTEVYSSGLWVITNQKIQLISHNELSLNNYPEVILPNMQYGKIHIQRDIRFDQITWQVAILFGGKLLIDFPLITTLDKLLS